jgi:hypothetical protein
MQLAGRFRNLECFFQSIEALEQKGALQTNPGALRHQRFGARRELFRGGEVPQRQCGVRFQREQIGAVGGLETFALVIEQNAAKREWAAPLCNFVSVLLQCVRISRVRTERSNRKSRREQRSARVFGDARSERARPRTLPTSQWSELLREPQRFGYLATVIGGGNSRKPLRACDRAGPSGRIVLSHSFVR